MAPLQGDSHTRLEMAPLQGTLSVAVKDFQVVELWVRETQECAEQFWSTKESPKIVLSLEAPKNGRLKHPLQPARRLGWSVALELGG